MFIGTRTLKNNGAVEWDCALTKPVSLDNIFTGGLERNWKLQVLSFSQVHTVNLRDYFQSQVAEFASQVGKFRYDEIMLNVDVETLNNMKEFIVV